MTDAIAGPKQLHRLLDAVMSLGSDLELDLVLRRMVEIAVDLVDARYGALGVLDPERTHLSDFITVGIDADTIADLGDPPKGHGILGLLIGDPRPLRLPDLRRHPDSFGFPPNHPPMTSFLGVPVFVSGVAYGNLYLTDKNGTQAFSEVDEELAVALAAAAGTAIEKARLHERARELDVIEDRDRIARDLHDTVIQRLFATGLSLHGAARMAAPLPEVAARIEACIDDLDQVVRQIRTTIFELHPPAIAETGPRQELLALGDDLADALGGAPTFTFEGPIDTAVGEPLAGHLLAVVGEALTNVARHAEASAAEVAVTVAEGLLTVIVDDDGRGIGRGGRDDTEAGTESSGRGLANVHERAVEVGGISEIGPRPGGGTRLRWVAPLP